MASLLSRARSSAGPFMHSLYKAGTAEYKRRLLATVPKIPCGTLLDVGCDDGEWTDQVRQAMGARPEHVSGIEAIEVQADKARALGFEVRTGDLEARWPYEDASFDVVHANQVIEHVKRLDHFVGEIRRVLKPGGTVVVCTENLASWHNVGALVLGYMPFSLTNISRKGPIGNPFSLYHGAAPHDEAWQHIHVVTLDGLQAIFAAHGFGTPQVFSAGYYPATGRVANALATRDPRHAHFIGLAATAPADTAERPSVAREAVSAA